MPSFRRWTLLPAALAALVGPACATGERPTLVPVAALADPPADTVASHLERARSADFTATYDIVPSTTGLATKATVAKRGDRLRVTIGDVVFTTDGTDASTCRGPDQVCTDALDDARVSDLNVTHLFWGPAFTRRLELDAARRIGPSVGSTAVIADRPAVCVDIVLPSAPMGTGVVTYCAVGDGPLARYFGADVSIELTSFSIDVAESALTG
ncbi:MAG TPA: hypothetical protein VIS05_01900 [Ilumatobacter sp.]